MTSDFSHLAGKQVTRDLRTTLTLYQLAGAPKLHMKPATEANKPYFNAMLRRTKRSARQLAKGNITAEMIEENREHDRELFPKFVVTGWDDVVDSRKQPVPFSAEACVQFINALPDWIFDDVRNHAGEATSFVQDDEPEVDEDSTGK